MEDLGLIEVVLIQASPPRYSPTKPQPVYVGVHAQAYWDVPVYREYQDLRANRIDVRIVNPGFVRVLENLESPGILFWHFPGQESPGKNPLVLESSGNLLNSTKKYEVYGRQ